MSDFFNKVIGGVEEPRFLLVGDELCENQSFEQGTDGWSISGTGGSIAQVSDQDTPFGNYCLRVRDVSISYQPYAEYTVDLGEVIAEKHFIATFWVKGSSSEKTPITIKLIDQSANAFATKTILILDRWIFFIIEGMVDYNNTNTQIALAIYPTNEEDGISARDTIYVDMVSIREVFFDKELPKPVRYEQRFKRVFQTQQTRRRGTKTRKVRGWRYEANFDHHYLEAAVERDRWVTSNQENLLFFPHKDYPLLFQVVWSPPFPVKYFGDEYVGHVGDSSLESLDIWPSEAFGLGRKYCILYDVREDWLKGFVSPSESLSWQMGDLLYMTNRSD